MVPRASTGLTQGVAQDDQGVDEQLHHARRHSPDGLDGREARWMMLPKVLLEGAQQSGHPQRHGVEDGADDLLVGCHG